MFKCEKIENHNIIHIKFDKPQWQNWGWIRIQEFYESPDNLVRGFHNTIEHIIERELFNNNEFTYLQDWDGFNVPGHIWDLFFIKHSQDVRDIEKEMANAVANLVDTNSIYYVIGSSAKSHRSTIHHEIRHGLWYLYDDYRREILEVLSRYKLDGLKRDLKKMGYCDEVIDDEIQAYVLTGLDQSMRKTKEIVQLKKHLKNIEKKYL